MRRLTRYSIRSLLVLITLACLVLGWYVANRNAWQREVAAIEALGNLMRGGEIATIEEGRTLFCGTGVNGVATVRLSRPHWHARRLNRRDNAIFERVVKISLSQPIDDRAIPHLAELKSLEEVEFFFCELSEEGKARLHGLLPNATIDFDATEELLEMIRARIRDEASSTSQPPTSAAPGRAKPPLELFGYAREVSRGT